nr:hypothetical protein GCM10025699_73580 [Microbacterium flavescens]
MITSTRRRRVRLGAALTLAGALVLAPVTAFAAEPGADAPTTTGAEEAQRTTETGAVVESPAPSDTAASTPAADPADPSGTPASTPAAEAPAADATEDAAEAPAPAETPVADATEDAPDAPAPAETPAATDETAGADALAAGELMNYVVNVDPTEPATAAARDAVVAAGGVVLMSYPEIGVVTAQSTDDGFLDAIRASSGCSRPDPRVRPPSPRAPSRPAGPAARSPSTARAPRAVRPRRRSSRSSGT